MADKGLHNLQPAKGSTKARKRVGRGPASGTGKTAGRGTKGQKSRSGSHMMRAGFEGGQMPLYMRIGKLRGSTHKMSMPMGPFRTYSQPVNVEQLARFEAGTEVTPALLRQAGILRSKKHPIKILGRGELNVKLTIVANSVSESARQKIEAAGGTIQLIAGPKPHGKAAGINKNAAANRAEADRVRDASAPKAPPVEESPAAAVETGTPDTGESEAPEA